MNAKLNNSNGWILCPSKSFPGKFYYFNVLTGETAWSCEADRRNLRTVNENIHKVTDRLHSYPEPADGPPSELFNSTNNYIGYNCTPKKNFGSPLHRPLLQHNFGTVNFTNYVSKTHEIVPHIWNPFNSFATQVQSKSKVDQCIQTQDNPNVFLFGHNKTNTQPFSFHSQSTNTSMDNGCNQFNSNLTSKRFIEAKSNNIQIKRSYQPSAASKLLIKEPVLKKQKPFGLSTENQFSNRSPLANIVPSLNTDLELSLEENLKDVTLKSDDLRYRLDAKRKRCEDSDEFNNNAALHPAQNLPANKKRVTFNLVDEQDEFTRASVNEDNAVIEEAIKPTLLDVQDLASLAVPNARTDFWYVLPDAEVLEKHFDVLKKMVAAAAPRLRLYVARCVFGALAACTRGVLRGSRSGLMQGLDVQEPESPIIVRNISTVERMLNFCMLLMTQKYHTVILTKDPNLYKRAKALSLHCFYIDEISLTPQTREKQISTTYQTIKQTIQKDCPKKTVAGNIFLQDPDKISLFPNNKTLSKKQENARFGQNKDNDLNNDSVTSDFDSDFKINVRLTGQNNSESEIRNSNGFEPLSVEISKSKWPSIEASETSICHWPLSKPKETSKCSNQPVSNVDEDRDCMNYSSDIMNKLKKNSVTSKIVEDRVRSRVDEWICCLTQIMEDALSEVLMDKTSASPPALPAPWYFNEAVVCIEQSTSDGRVAQIAAVLGSLLAKNSHGKYGNLKSTIQAKDLLQIFGCSRLLLQALQTVSPSCIELAPALTELRSLRRLLRSPALDPDAEWLAEHARAIHAEDDDDDENDARHIFVKNKSDVLQYLTKHFPSWRGVDEQFALENTQDFKVIRTLGKNLKHLKIVKNINNSTELRMNKSLDAKVIDEDPITKENLKFIRKSNLIQSFESKLTIREPIDMDALDYDADSNELNGNGVIEGDRMTDSMTDDSSDDSGVLAFLFVKEFLVGLSRALKDVYEFVAGIVEELSTPSNNKVVELSVRGRADRMAQWLHSIQEPLKSIVSRESDPRSSIASLLASRVPRAEAERRAAEYRSMVILCEQQSSLLASCLDHLCTRLHCTT